MEHFPRRSDAESSGGVTGHGGAADAAGAPITPLDLPQGCRDVVLFGGTFDPPHRWHMRGPMQIAHAVGACLLVVPAAKNPLKATGPVASDEDRVAMVRLALDAATAGSEFHHGVRVWTDEIDRAKWARDRGLTTPSYTIDTVRRLRVVVGTGVRLRMIIGVDQALKFHEWRDYRDLMELAEPIVMPRDGVGTSAQLERAIAETGAWSAEEAAKWGRRLAKVDMVPIASTHVREAIKRGEASLQLDASVQRYVEERGLYR